MSTTTASSTSARAPPAFEFPKRKRWADLLLTELVDDIAFVLSPAYKILYCGPSITELLGWKDSNLSDVDFFDLVSEGDQDRCRVAFEQAMQKSVEFDIAVSLKTSASASQYQTPPSQQEMLFEMKFYPYIGTDEAESRCIFGMAVPYASRNTLMLNTILDLRAENDRLQMQITERRARLPLDAAAPANSQPAPPQAGSMYATSSLNAARAPSAPVPHKSGEGPGAMGDPYGAANAGAMAEMLEFGKAGLYSSVPSAEEQSEDGPKRKKLKRLQNAEQYVCITCGRTDSPEWRKGPLGPKTLCNACGLRWAKQMRKVDEPTDEAANSGSGA